MLFGIGFLAFQARPVTVFDRAIDDFYKIRVVATFLSGGGTLARVLLVDQTNADRFWELARLIEPFDLYFKVERADQAAIVLSRTTDYGIQEGFIKLFFHSPSRRLLKRIDFKSHESLKFVSREEARRVGIDGQLLLLLQNISLYPSLDDPDPPAIGNQLLPQSNWQAFARLRPQRVKDGYRESRVKIEEKIGPWQNVDRRIWFGKTFHDGEGYTGIGGLGHFDISLKKFTLLEIPELVDWSVSALLVEDEAIWAGLETYQEGAGTSGGLLRYDLKTKTSQVYLVEPSIRKIVRSGDAIVLGTINGIFVFKDGRFTWHRAEPGITGKFAFHSVTL